jgi:hypothetical protein
MMSRSLDELERAPNQTDLVADSAPPAVLRQRRTALGLISARLSYAMEVLALDLKVLNRRKGSEVETLQAIVDDLPEILAESWCGSTWSFSVDTSDFTAATAETDGLLDLHHEMVTSDLADPRIARSLSVRMEVRRSALLERNSQLEKEIKEIQESLLRQGVAGMASTDDWLD